jgi:hypothetical protein
MGTTLIMSIYTNYLAVVDSLPSSPRQLGGVSQFEALLPHGQPRLTFSEIRLPILH